MRQDEKYAPHTRNRIIEWPDRGAVRAEGDGFSALDTMRAIRDGRLPPPPIAGLLGFHYVGAEPGEIVIELESGQWLENSAETHHTGVAAALLDTAMSAAVGTLLSMNTGAITLDLKISYLKPLTIESGPIRAIGRVVDLAEPTAFVTGQIHNGDGSLAVHAIGVVSAITSKETLSSVPRAVSNKPRIWSTIWRTLEAMS